LFCEYYKIPKSERLFIRKKIIETYKFRFFELKVLFIDLLFAYYKYLTPRPIKRWLKKLLLKEVN